MTIGIVSINIHTTVLNFASVLHSYAFQHFLGEHGIASTVVDYVPSYYLDYDTRHPLNTCLAKPDSDPERQAREVAKWEALYQAREIRFDKLEAFYKTHYRLTGRSYTGEELERLDPGFDCYLCVTDVIWKYTRHYGFEPAFFLANKAMADKKKIAYAASRGGSKFSPEKEAEFLPMVADFDLISSRELEFQHYLTGLLGQDIPQVVDPVFLNDLDFYEGLEQRPASVPDGPYVLLYTVMDDTPELRRQTIAFAAERGLPVVELSEGTGAEGVPEGLDYRIVYDIGVEEWLWYMHHADYIFTNSFHCCCFSAMYGKIFFAGARGGDKIPTILKLLGLEDRRVLSDDDLRRALTTPIDWEQVAARIAACRKTSADWILSAIHEMEGREHRPMIPPEEVPRILRERNRLRSRKQLYNRIKPNNHRARVVLKKILGIP